MIIDMSPLFPPWRDLERGGAEAKRVYSLLLSHKFFLEMNACVCNALFIDGVIASTQDEKFRVYCSACFNYNDSHSKYFYLMSNCNAQSQFILYKK
jgi:hypothetical protein